MCPSPIPHPPSAQHPAWHPKGPFLSCEFLVNEENLPSCLASHTHIPIHSSCKLLNTPSLRATLGPQRANKGGEWGEGGGREKQKPVPALRKLSVQGGQPQFRCLWVGAKQRGLLTRDTRKQAPGEGVGSCGLGDPIGSQRSSRNSSEAERGVVRFCRGKASKVFPGPWKVFPIPGKQGDWLWLSAKPQWRRSSCKGV